MNTTSHANLPKIALVLQGGGALGSYQAGVYQALHEANYAPDWVAGISIGAFNGAVIAGNAPEKRVERLRDFWKAITTPAPAFSSMLLSDALTRQWHASCALMFGQSGFFTPQTQNLWGDPSMSMYSTKALRATLEEFVDFDRLNSGETRFSVAAANVRTGDFAYFDSRDITIRAEHIMASGALPPGFPSVEIDGEQYWDGGLVSNTPLQYIFDYVPRRSLLAFQVDLFNALGALPTDLDSVLEREKDIRYSSRTRAATDMYRLIHDVRHNINSLIQLLPEELRQTSEAKFLYEFGCVTTMDIVRLSYQPFEAQGASKDYAFGRGSMEERWSQGLSDANRALRASPWLEPRAPENGARLFDFGLTPDSEAQTSLMSYRSTGEKHHPASCE